MIRLDEEHKCPFLSENRLCRLVSAYGDSVLSETCTVFPREVHRFETHEEEVLMPSLPGGDRSLGKGRERGFSGGAGKRQKSADDDP